MVVVRAGTSQEETASSDFKNHYVGFRFLGGFIENLVAISCFRTFLIYNQSYIFNICIYLYAFFLTCFVPFFPFVYVLLFDAVVTRARKRAG